MGQKEQPAADAGSADSDGEQAAAEAPIWQTAGEHRFHIREDMLFWKVHGVITVEDLKVFFAQRIALQEQRGRVFLLVDARDFASLPAETRKYAVQFKPDRPFRGALVVFGAGVLIRTAVSLILAAVRLVGRRDLSTVFFVADEGEGRALIQKERLALEEAEPPG